MTHATYKMTGNTYQNRTEIKSLGAKWNHAEKAWYVKGSLHIDTVWKLRRQGVVVTTQNGTRNEAPAVSAATKRRAWTRSEASVGMHAIYDEPERFPMQPHEPAPSVCERCGIETCPDGCCCGC